MNWRGRPLTSHQVVVATIASTRTRTGLRVAAALDTGSYPLGIAVSAGELRRLPITAHARHGAWNYTIAPTRQLRPGFYDFDATLGDERRTSVGGTSSQGYPATEVLHV